MNTTQTEDSQAVAGQVERPVRPLLPYTTAAALYMAARRGERRFVLHYHDREPRQITGISLGAGCVWVEAGRMLPVHIYPNGASKDGPAIWLEAAEQTANLTATRGQKGTDEHDTNSRQPGRGGSSSATC